MKQIQKKLRKNKKNAGELIPFDNNLYRRLFFMEQITDFIKDHKKEVIIVVLLVFLLSIQIYLVIALSNKKGVKELTNEEETNEIIKKEEIENEEIQSYLVDIKGEVKNPGAYDVSKDTRIKDVINLAGGLTNNADTIATNLSLKVKDEMVIIIYSKNQIKEITKVKEEETKVNNTCNNDSLTSNNACLSSNNKANQTNSLININTASKEQLLTLPGIGDAKANNIIDYRKINGNFKVITDLKNVTGIGDSIYDQIKNLITI